MNKRIETINKCFIQFLKSNNAFAKYRLECERHYVRRLKKGFSAKTITIVPDDINDTSIYAHGLKLIMCSFSWEESKDGSGFWGKLYLKWKDVLGKLKLNDYEISEDILSTILVKRNTD